MKYITFSSKSYLHSIRVLCMHTYATYLFWSKREVENLTYRFNKMKIPCGSFYDTNINFYNACDILNRLHGMSVIYQSIEFVWASTKICPWSCSITKMQIIAWAFIVERKLTCWPNFDTSAGLKLLGLRC